MKMYNKTIHKAEAGVTYKGTVAAYMRYSSDNQDEHSIEYQRQAITEYCKKENYFLLAEYWDEAYTGTNDRRPSFQKMIADAGENPPWQTILVFDYSRWFRDTNYSTLYEITLLDLGIDVFSITEQFDTSSEGMLMRDVKKAFNAFTSRNIAKFTHAGMVTNAKNGEHCGGVPPLGYDIINKKLVINEYEAEIVRRIFDMYENNYSYKQMAEELNGMGYRTKFDQPFTYNSFSSILHQEKYAGTYVWNKASGKGASGKRNSHKAKAEAEQIRKEDDTIVIIPRAQFDRVQKMFADRQNGTATSKSRRFYLLGSGGFLKCAECGALMIGEVVKSHGRSYKYYYCPNHKKAGKKCSNVGIKAKILEPFVVNTLVKEISQREDLISLYNTSDEKDKINQIKNQIAGLDKASKNLVNEFASGKSKEAIDDLRAKLKDVAIRKQHLSAELEELKRGIKPLADKDRMELCKKIAKVIYKSESLEAKKYLKEAIKEITVSNDNVEILMNIA